jgi:hypothetical protein
VGSSAPPVLRSAPRQPARFNTSRYTGYTQKNGAVSLYSQLKPHHSFVYTLYLRCSVADINWQAGSHNEHVNGKRGFYCVTKGPTPKCNIHQFTHNALHMLSAFHKQPRQIKRCSVMNSQVAAISDSYYSNTARQY